jgi:hypothetical protein
VSQRVLILSRPLLLSLKPLALCSSPSRSRERKSLTNLSSSPFVYGRRDVDFPGKESRLQRSFCCDWGYAGRRHIANMNDWSCPAAVSRIFALLSSLGRKDEKMCASEVVHRYITRLTRSRLLIIYCCNRYSKHMYEHHDPGR